MREKVAHGICNKNCPVFNASLQPRYSPRGFVQLIDEGIKHQCIFTCTLCGNCENDNPANIELVKIFRKERQSLVEQGKDIPVFAAMIENLQKTGNIYGIQDQQ